MPNNKEDIDIGRVWGTILDNRWLIIGITMIFSIIGLAYGIFSTPIYRADALVQIEKSSDSSLLTSISEMIPDSQPASAAEIGLIRSRMVVGKSVEELGLETVVKRKFFPVLGTGYARIIGTEPATVLVSKFTIPRTDEDSTFIVKIENANSYILTHAGKSFKGTKGQLETFGNISLQINDFNAPIGAEFEISKRSELSAINDVLNNLTINDTGKDTGILNLSFTDEDPLNTKKILDSIIENYQLQNIERKSAEAGNSLNFIKVQLPTVRSQLDEAEDKLNLYRQSKDSVDLNLEAKSVLDSLTQLDSQLNELTFKEAEISKLYTKEHPAYRALLEKKQILEDEKDKLNKKVGVLPKTQQEILKLTRDVQAGQQIFMQLLNRQQELSIDKASTVGNVRIVDKAITQPLPIKPNKALIVFLTTILGLVAAIIYSLLKLVFHRGIESPEQLEEIGINVYASIPISEWQLKKDKILVRSKSKHVKHELLATGDPADVAVESIRSLRTSLHFAMLEAKNNILMITGANPGIGKTFVTTNLAAVLAQSKKKILLIDADLRRGHIHELFDLQNKAGLSEVLSAQIEPMHAIRNTEIENLSFVARGVIPPNPSELLMSKRFDEFLQLCSLEFDIVLIDTPPILAVTDAAIIGRHVGTSLMVARYGVNTTKEIEISFKRFEQNGIVIKGTVLNAVENKASTYYSDYRNYTYEYK